MTKARDLGKLVSQGQPLADGTVQASEVSGLAAVATSGSYNDLLDKPTSTPGSFSGNYADLTNKPTFATVATSGSYADLTNKPTLFSGSYTDLTNKPTLFDGSYNTLTDKPTLFSGSYADLTNKPTLFNGDYSNLTNRPQLATVATSGSYTDLVNKPVITTLKVSSITYPGDDLAADPAGGQTITLTGTGFAAGAQVLVDTTVASVVTVVDPTTITFTAPAKAAGNYVLYVVNTDGSVALSLPGISYSGVPAWSTSAGTLGTQYEATAISKTLAASSDSAITYSIVSGSLPPGSTLNTSTGVITGTSPTVGGSTTYNFTIRATDAQNQDTDRAFSITISPDVVTWSSPQNNYTVTAELGQAVSLALLATSSAGNQITYTADSLPPGLSISNSTISGTTTQETTSSSTITATAANTSKTAARTINWTITQTLEPYFKYTTLLLTGNGTNGSQNNTFLDSSANSFTITRNGETSQGAFSPYGECWSNYFDDGLTASSSYITTASSSTFAITDFTIEFFINWTFVQDISSIVDFVGYDTGFSLRASNSGLFMYLQGGTYYSSPVFTWNLGEWYHIAVVRSGSTLYWYVNGTRLGTTTSVPSAAIPAGQARIGGILTGGVYNTSKYISNLRVVSSALYTGSTLTVPTSNLTAISGTVLLTCQSNRFKDNSSSNLTITPTGNTTSVQRFSPFNPSQSYSAAAIGGSGFFGTPSGTVSNLAISPAGLSSMSTWTMEFWAYNSPASWTDHAVLGPWGPNLIRDSGNNLEVYLAGGQRFGSIAWRKNQWNHVALSNDNTSLRLYVNGTLVNTTTSTTINLSTMVIGSEQTNNVSNDKWNGYITDFRVINGTALYSGSTITVPTTPLAAITNTSLLLQFTNAGIIDNAMIHDLTTAGNVQISTSTLKYGSGSIYFDGSGDFLKIPYNDLFNIGGGDYTAEAWIYPTQHGEIVGAFNLAGPNFAGWLLSTNFINGTGKLGTYFANTTTYQSNITSTATVSLNTWSHIAFTKQGTTVRLFINGGLDSTHTLTLTPSGSQQQIHIGADSNSLTSPGRNFGGYIDDLRITKGYARYTSSFTPPAALKTR